MQEAGIKLEYEKLKIVFTNEANTEDTDLFVELTFKRDGDNKLTQVSIDPSVFEKEPSFAGNVYLDVVNLLMVIKKQLDDNQPYEKVHVLTREEYKQYVIKVLGHKIED